MLYLLYFLIFLAILKYHYNESKKPKYLNENFENVINSNNIII